MNKLVIGIFERFAAVKELIFPVPVIAGRPTALLVCDHLYSVPKTVEPVNRIGAVKILVQSA